jgi:hypothetical protein
LRLENIVVVEEWRSGVKRIKRTRRTLCLLIHLYRRSFNSSPEMRRARIYCTDTCDSLTIPLFSISKDSL